MRAVVVKAKIDFNIKTQEPFPIWNLENNEILSIKAGDRITINDLYNENEVFLYSTTWVAIPRSYVETEILKVYSEKWK